MEQDGPVTTVQIRLAKGEIHPSEYEEIMKHLMKNISSFQQTSSLKILQMRYAKSEITRDQYNHILAHLMEKLYAHPWSPPLHILHTRYAEGEITTEEYTEMFRNLTDDQFTYEQSTPLWILNNRYAQGEISTQEYENILQLFSEVKPVLPHNSDARFEMPATIAPIESSGILREEPQRSLHTIHIQKSPVSQSSSLSSSQSPESFFQDEENFGDRIDLRDDLLDLPTLASAEITDPYTSMMSAAQSQQELVSEQGPSFQSISSYIEEPEAFAASFHIPDLKPTTQPSGSHLHFSSRQAESTKTEALPSGFLLPDQPDQNAGKTAAISIFDLTHTMPGSSPNISLPEEKIQDGTSQGTSDDQEIQPEPVIQDSSHIINEDAPVSEIEDDSAGDPRQHIKMLIAKGRYTEADKFAESLMKHSPDSYLPYFFKGMAQYYLRSYDDALTDLNTARDLCQNKADLKKIDTIRSHIIAKQSEQNKTDITSVIETTHNADPEGEPGAMHEDGTRDSDISTDILDTLRDKAMNCLSKREFKEAENLLEEYLTHCSSFTPEQLRAERVDEIYSSMGLARYQLKKYSEARDDFTEAIQINPSNLQANQYLQDILIRAAKKR
jgi:uncharacterized membrane protein